MPDRYSRGWFLTTPMGRALRTITKLHGPAPRFSDLCPLLTTPFPENINEPIELHEACDLRAKELVEKYQTIYVCWSGGVDSTLVAAYLGKHKKPDTELILSVSDQSLQDASSGVLDALVAQGYSTEEISPDRMREVASLGGMVVCGHHADSILLGELVDDTGAYESIWTMSPTEMISNHTGVSLEAAAGLLHDIEPLLAKMPFERTAANIAWWIDFTCFWDTDEMDFMIRFGLEPPGVGYVCFFGTPEFQRWAMRDVSEKAGNTEATYKHQYVSLISSILGKHEFVTKNRLDVGCANAYSSRMVKIREDYTVVCTR